MVVASAVSLSRSRGFAPRGGVLVLELNRKRRVLELITFNHIYHFTHLLYLYQVILTAFDSDSHSVGRVCESLAKTTELAVTTGAAEMHSIQD